MLLVGSGGRRVSRASAGRDRASGSADRSRYAVPIVSAGSGYSGESLCARCAGRSHGAWAADKIGWEPPRKIGIIGAFYQAVGARELSKGMSAKGKRDSGQRELPFDEPEADDSPASQNGASSTHNGAAETNGNQASPRQRRRATAETMAAGQRDISVSEFFAKNRHLLGFDNPRKALLTTVKEAVDNSLDAGEEAGIVL